MARLVLITSFLSLISLSSMAADKSEKIGGVNFESNKEGDIRTYEAKTTKEFAHPVQTVRKAITNFANKCNNEYKDKRKFSSLTSDCKFHNANFIETFYVTALKQKTYPREIGETQRFLMGRRAYNRGEFGYYEIVKIFESKNDKGLTTIKIVQEMLDNEQVAIFTEPKFSRESAFDKSKTTFTLTEIEPMKTLVTYSYQAQTTHWVLNKELSIPQVFASINQSVKDLLTTVDQESQIYRTLASEK